jgi:hypothetical protein
VDLGRPRPVVTIYQREDTRERAEIERDSINFMEHHLDEGMKEVLVYSRTNTDGPRRPRESSELVEVDLAGSQSRLALGTDSPLSDPKNS